MSDTLRFINEDALKVFQSNDLMHSSSPDVVAGVLANRIRDKQPMFIKNVVAERFPIAVFVAVLEWFEIYESGVTLLHFVGGRTLYLEAAKE